MSVQLISLLNAVAITGPGTPVQIPVSKKSFQVSVAGVGAVTASVNIEVSDDQVKWELAATVALSGTTSAHDGFNADNPWIYTRANITAITGTSAVVSVIGGYIA